MKIILSERLLYFSKHGFPLQVHELLENGADPNYVDEKSNLSVQEYAILDVSDKVFDVLMAHHNIDLTQKNKAHETPLEMAIKFNKSSKAIKLIEHQASLDDSLLVLALRQKPLTIR